MRKQPRWSVRRPSLGTVFGFVALSISLGGTAYAVATIDSSDVVNGSLLSRDIQNTTLRTADYKDGSVKKADVDDDAVGASELERTAASSSGVIVGPGQAGEVTKECTDSDEQIVSGGFQWDIDAAGLEVTHFEVHVNNNEVHVRGFNDTIGNRTLTALAFCIEE